MRHDLYLYLSKSCYCRIYHTSTPLHHYMSSIHAFTPYPLYANYINLVITAPLHYWPLYIRYSHAHFILIASILSLLYRCIATLLYIRYLCIQSVLIVSILSPPYRCITTLLHCWPLNVRYLRTYFVHANCINFVNTVPLHCWLLYFRYSCAHSIPIALILSPPYCCIPTSL